MDGAHLLRRSSWTFCYLLVALLGGGLNHSASGAPQLRELAPDARANDDQARRTQEGPQSIGQPATENTGSLVEVDPVDSRIKALADSVSQRQASLAEDQEADESTSKALRELLAQAASDLGDAQGYLTKKQSWIDKQQNAPDEFEARRIEKGKIEAVDDSEPIDFSRYGLEEGQAQLQALKTALANEATNKSNLAAEIDRRTNRLGELLKAISDAKSDLEGLVASPPDDGADEPLSQARRWAWEAKQLAAQEKLRALESERLAYEAEARLLPLELELAEKRSEKLQGQIARLTAALADQRQIRINNLHFQFAQANAPEGDPYDRIRQWLRFGENEDANATTWMRLSDKAEVLRGELEQAQADLELWRESLRKMRRRVDPTSANEFVPAANRWVVERLREQREELPGLRAETLRLRNLQSQLEVVQSLEFDVEQATRELKSLSAPGDAASVPAYVEVGLEVVDAFEGDISEYRESLLLAADLTEQTIQLSEEYRGFIDKQLLWTPNAARLAVSDLKPAGEAVAWLLSFENWRLVASLYRDDFLRNAVLYLLFGFAVCVLVFNQPRMRRRLGDLSAKSRRNSCVDFKPSLNGLFLTLFIAAPLPLWLLFLYWRLNECCQFELLPKPFPRALAGALLLSAGTLFPMELLRQVCRNDGLAISHFGWREQATKILRTNLRWLIDFSIPLAGIIGLFVSQQEAVWEKSFGRMAFIVLMPLLSVFFARVFKPSQGIFEEFLKKNRGGWVDRLSYVWYPVIVGGPVVLAALSFAGYHYTSQQLAQRLVATLWMVVLLTVAFCLLKRWLVLNRRKLMVAQAKQRLQDAAKRDRSKLPIAISKSDDDAPNLVALNEQTKRLVTSFFVTLGLLFAFLIWSDVLPAISLLDNVVLWRPDEEVAITLANLVLVIPIVVLATIAARNVPGLLEIAFLQHLPLSNAARYAISTLARYAIVGLGILVTSSALGLRWSNIQWLVAGLGVGLGFGLQEIFANFISGIILLFEQPIRVGDIVTIDGTTGTVARIRMRATTIVNWDRQELIVPNKEFITGKLINWTLTDTTNRIVMNVGVAYGSDAEKACDIIRHVCQEHAEIMSDPSPLVTFEGFGDNTLNLVVRAYLASLDNRLSTVHELHQQIYAAFNQAGIEIAFPQRDLHLRSLPDSLAQWLAGGSQRSSDTSHAAP